MDEKQNRNVKTAKGYKKSNENNLIGSPIPTRYSRELTHSATNQRSKNNLIGRPTPVRYSRELRHSTSNESCGTSQTQKSDKKDD